MTGKASRRVRLTDVARRAGVSASTASYILRQVEPQFSRYEQRTIDRVRKAAEAVGYKRNLLAAWLRMQHVPYFGVFFELVRPGDWGPTGRQSVVMWRVFEGIAGRARQNRRYPVVLTRPEPGDPWADSPGELDSVVQAGLCGVIAAVHPETWDEHLSRWEAAGVPTVSLFDSGPPDAPRWSVDIDNEAVGRLAWDHLAQHGHRRILCLQQKKPARAVLDRIEALGSAVADAGADMATLELPSSGDHVGHISDRDGPLVLKTLADCRASAIVAVDGGAGIVAHLVLTRQGVRLGEECSLIGIDLPFWSPAAQVVTEIVCPGETIGEHAADLLARRLKGGKAAAEPVEIRVPPTLESRASVGPAPG